VRCPPAQQLNVGLIVVEEVGKMVQAGALPSPTGHTASLSEVEGRDSECFNIARHVIDTQIKPWCLDLDCIV